MKVWEAHRIIADAVGDSADIDSENLYDGVRYSKAERNSYLYQGLISYFNQLIHPLKRAPRKQLVSLIDRYFPNMKESYSLGITLADDYQIHITDVGAPAQVGYFNPAIILDMYVKAYAENGVNFRGFPIPFKTSDQVAELINTRNAFKPDMFFTYAKSQLNVRGLFEIHDYQEELKDLEAEFGNVVGEVTVLNYPQNPKDQLPTDDINIEEAYIDKVINKAIVFAMRDDQEVEGIERVQSIIEPFMQGGR